MGVGINVASPGGLAGAALWDRVGGCIGVAGPSTRVLGLCPDCKGTLLGLEAVPLATPLAGNRFTRTAGSFEPVAGDFTGGALAGRVADCSTGFEMVARVPALDSASSSSLAAWDWARSPKADLLLGRVPGACCLEFLISCFGSAASTTVSSILTWHN